MYDFLQQVADLIYQYGRAGAGMPSLRGNNEMAVPAELIECEDED